MMLAEAGICGNRGVADGGPFVGLGLFQPVCMSEWGAWGAVAGEEDGGGFSKGPLFLD